MIFIDFHPEAQLELFEAVRYYESQQLHLGKSLFVTVRNALEHLHAFPMLYSEIEPGIRRCRIARFPYGVIYRFLDDQIQIVAVMHLHRKPGYWKTRVGE